MTTLANRKTGLEEAEWAEGYASPEPSFARQDGIATESQPSKSPAWTECIEVLLKALHETPEVGSAAADEERPNRASIKAALHWVEYLQRRFPFEPPTCIVPEPSGGIIVERRGTNANGKSCICELTFQNDGTAERVDFVDGRVVRMKPISPRPS